MKRLFESFRFWVVKEQLLLEDYKLPASAVRGYTGPGWYYIYFQPNSVFNKWALGKELSKFPAFTAEQLNTPGWVPNSHMSEFRRDFVDFSGDVGREIAEYVKTGKRGFAYWANMRRVPEEDQAKISGLKIGPDKNILMKNFFKKEVGQSLEFFKKRLEQFYSYRKSLKDKEVSGLGKVFYHASIKELEIGDIIEPYWTKELMAQRSAAAVGAANPIEIEKEFEKVRPKNKVSRLNCVFAYDDAGRAFAHEGPGDVETRHVYAVQPLPKSKITVADQGGLGQFAVVLSDMRDVEDEEEEEYLNKALDEIINNYWAGKSVSSGGGTLDSERQEILIGPPGVKIVKVLR